MRLSDFENEEALDLLADLIDPAARIMADKKVEAMINGRKPTLIVASYVLKHHKQEAIEVVAALHKTTPDKVKFTAVSVINDLLDVLNDPEIQMLFGFAEQTGGSSGSAMESTEEEKR